MHGFIFKQNNGLEYDSKDFNILVNSKPMLIKAEKNIELVEIPGRDGALTIDRETYKDMTLLYECTILNNSCGKCINSNTIYEDSLIINEWLEGQGTLIMSHIPQCEFKVKYVEFEGIELDNEVGTFNVAFICEPYKYLPKEVITVDKGIAEIINPSRVSAKPIIKAYGNGTLQFSINGNKVTINNVSKEVTVNSELFECYEGNKNLNNNMVGEYPIIKKGKNTIETNNNMEIIIQWKYK